jgi:hypothetical protein
MTELVPRTCLFLPPGLRRLHVKLAGFKGSGINTGFAVDGPPAKTNFVGTLQGSLLDASPGAWTNSSAAGSFVICEAGARANEWANRYPFGAWAFLAINGGPGGFQDATWTMWVGASELMAWWTRATFDPDGEPLDLYEKPDPDPDPKPDPDPVPEGVLTRAEVVAVADKLLEIDERVQDLMGWLYDKGIEKP